MTHTPGPWRTYAAKTSTGEETIGIMTDKEYMAMMETVSIDGGPYKLPPRAVANARLMAAAPELLEALQWFVTWTEKHNLNMAAPCIDGVQRECPVVLIARAAIAKATGEEVTPC